MSWGSEGPKLNVRPPSVDTVDRVEDVQLAGLASGDPWHLVGERDLSGPLQPGQRPADVLAELLGQGTIAGAGVDLDQRGDAFTEVLIGYADDDHVAHRGVGGQRVLDLAAVDVHATRQIMSARRSVR